MPELQRSLDALARRLDHMGLRVAQAVDNALRAIRDGNIVAGERVGRDDSQIDQEEVEIEKECIDLLALYEPKAVDLRRICCIIKVNNDLERIADLAARLGRQVEHLVAGNVAIHDFPEFDELEKAARNILEMTVRLLNSTEANLPRQVIEADRDVDTACRRFALAVLETAKRHPGNIDAPLTLITLARSLERIGDHCTNIAEDTFFFLTGEIVRHSASFKYKS
jgi:phosphate transport system protein